MSLKLLTEHHLKFLSLKGGCTGSSEFTFVKMPHCWKSHVTALLKLHAYCIQCMGTTTNLKTLVLVAPIVNGCFMFNPGFFVFDPGLEMSIELIMAFLV